MSRCDEWPLDWRVSLKHFYQQFTYRKILSLVPVGLLLVTSGCGTTAAHFNYQGFEEDLERRGIKVYRGVHFDSAMLYLAEGDVLVVPFLFDLPLSAAADTLLLPYDLCVPITGKPPEGAQRATFVRLKGDYSKDNSHVFYRKRVIEGADPKSFVVLSDDGCWACDDNKAYRFGTPLKVEDLSTFSVVEGEWAKDSRAYYSAFLPPNDIGGCKVDCDYPTLQVLGGYYAKDKNRAYYCGRPIEGVDLDSFVATDHEHAEDKYDKYSNYSYGVLAPPYKVPKTPTK